MSIIYTETKSDADSRTEIDIGDGRRLNITITGEGIVMDVYARRAGIAKAVERIADGEHIIDVLTQRENDGHLGTAAMMFDEWADWLVQFNKECDVIWPEKT